MDRKKLSTLVEGGILLGIAEALTFFTLFTMPYGGGVTLGPLPIIVFAMRRGVKEGAFLGVLYGLLHFILTTKFSFHPLSILLDYLIPGAALGLVALGKHNIGFILTALVRFGSYFLSGIILWGSYAGDTNPILYSFIYNITYVILELFLIFIIIIILKKFTPIFSPQ